MGLGLTVTQWPTAGGHPSHQPCLHRPRLTGGRQPGDYLGDLLLGVRVPLGFRGFRLSACFSNDPIAARRLTLRRTGRDSSPNLKGIITPLARVQSARLQLYNPYSLAIATYTRDSSSLTANMPDGWWTELPGRITRALTGSRPTWVLPALPSLPTWASPNPQRGLRVWKSGSNDVVE